jgi:hypothetical protein
MCVVALFQRTVSIVVPFAASTIASGIGSVSSAPDEPGEELGTGLGVG